MNLAAELEQNQHVGVAPTAALRCQRYRRRILEMSQQVTALHMASAFSCLEMVDVVYQRLLRPADVFLMSKGHGCLAQYVVLEDLGVLPRADLDAFCTASGRLGTHPDIGPGIHASTGSLGHGLGIAAGMAYATKLQESGRMVYVMLSDGELQEGSTWEAMMVAANLGLDNLVALVDLNDFQSLGRASELHPHLYPVAEKARAFGWEAAVVDGHNPDAVCAAAVGRSGEQPFLLAGRTVKGKGVSFMENVPIWHYRSPSPQEYTQAMAELGGNPFPENEGT
ncbi:MAG: transketolase [Sulfuritalea sp.]|nr:transketolase [Sulfuritalea sp.]